MLKHILEKTFYYNVLYTISVLFQEVLRSTREEAASNTPSECSLDRGRWLALDEPVL